MFGFLKTALADLQAEAAKYADRETAEAIVAVMTGCAYADGALEPEEKAKLAGAFKINPILKQYETGVLLAKHNELAEQCEFDIEIGLDACLKELNDVARKGADEGKRLAILKLGVASAKADGEVEPAEREFLTRACRVLGLQPSQVGL